MMVMVVISSHRTTNYSCRCNLLISFFCSINVTGFKNGRTQNEAYYNYRKPPPPRRVQVTGGQESEGCWDIGVLFSQQCQVSEDWCRYLRKLFIERKVTFVPVEDLDVAKDERVAEAVRAKSQLLLLGPDFNRWAQRSTTGILEQILNPRKILALFLALTEVDVSETFKRLPQWRIKMEVESNSEEFAKKVFHSAHRIITEDTFIPNNNNNFKAKMPEWKIHPERTSFSSLRNGEEINVFATEAVAKVKIFDKTRDGGETEIQCEIRKEMTSMHVALKFPRFSPFFNSGFAEDEDGKYLSLEIAFESQRSIRAEKAVFIASPLNESLKNIWQALPTFEPNVDKERYDAQLADFISNDSSPEKLLLNWSRENKMEKTEKAVLSVMISRRDESSVSLRGSQNSREMQKVLKTAMTADPNLDKERCDAHLADLVLDAAKVEKESYVEKTLKWARENKMEKTEKAILSVGKKPPPRDESLLRVQRSVQKQKSDYPYLPMQRVLKAGAMNDEQDNDDEAKKSASLEINNKPQSRQEIIRSINDLSSEHNSSEGLFRVKDNSTPEAIEEKEEDDDDDNDDEEDDTDDDIPDLNIVGFNPSNHDDLTTANSSASPSSSELSLFESCQAELIELQEQFKQEMLSLREVEEKFEAWKSRPEVNKLKGKRKEDLEKMRQEWLRLQQLAQERSKKESQIWQLFKGLTGLTRIRKKTLSNSSSSAPNNSNNNTTNSDPVDAPAPMLETPSSSSSSTERQRRKSHQERPSRSIKPLPRVASHVGTFASPPASSSSIKSKSVFYDENYDVPRQLSASTAAVMMPVTPPRRVDSLPKTAEEDEREDDDDDRRREEIYQNMS